MDIALSTTPGQRRWLGVIVGLLGLAALTFAMRPLHGTLSLAGVTLLYLVPVVAAAVVGGVRPALLAAVCADLLVNFFFLTPYHTFAVDTAAGVVVLVVYVLVAATVAVAVDVAARQRAAAGQRAAEARELAAVDRLRTALLDAVGHDLRTPLAGIKAAASSLRQPDVALRPEDRADLLATVEESTDRMVALVENLLSLSRRRAGVLERVCANLITNALTATAPAGTVLVTGEADDDVLRLRVIDHGPGLPAQTRERVFQPFQRLGDRGHGLGLGLAIARGFTEAMGGRLEPSETPGGGLTMTVTVPRA